MPVTLDERILDLAYAGHSVDEIANALGADPNTVRTAISDLTKLPGDTLVGPKGDKGDKGDTGDAGLSAPFASGAATITGTGTVTTGLSGAITSVVCGMKTSDTAPGAGFSCSADAGVTAGAIAVVVRDIAGAEATDPADVFWIASDA